MKLLGLVTRKLIAVGLLALFIAGLLLAAIQPLHDRYAAAQDSLEQQRLLLGRLIASARPGAMNSSGPARPVSDYFLAGDSDAGRLAGMQSRVDRAAQNAGTRLSSTQVMTPRETQGIRLLGIETQLSANLDQLQVILIALETAAPALIVDSLSITRAPDAELAGRPELDVRLVVSGAAAGSKS